jgi:hypothetical protein
MGCRCLSLIGSADVWLRACLSMASETRRVGPWRRLEQDVRTCRTRTFPYAILYTLEADSMLIVAVMHLRREPGILAEPNTFQKPLTTRCIRTEMLPEAFETSARFSRGT